jgi:predicted extracellular nuclease
MNRGGSRKPLAAQFEVGGHRLFVINNHFNSKGGDDRLFGVFQPRLPLSEAQRRDQAAVVHRFVERILDTEPDAWIIVLGDLNEHDFGRPLDLLAGDQLVNLLAAQPPEDRYTYVYRGRGSAIDHILVSRSLHRSTEPEVDIAHLNADRSATFRASDHDPVVARFRLPVD